ncbi:MAG: hypothetical protein GY769_24630 [bacterium]|nr:hypothetical protein [bacterium]
MNASRSKRFFTLALAAAFVLSAVPAAAAGSSASAQQFDLQLDKALSGLDDDLSILDLDYEALAAAHKAQEPVQVAMLSTTAVNELLTSSQAVAAQSSGGGSSSGKKGSWLKRKWWIPVLAAVAVGVAVGGGDGDDNIDDEED